LHRLYITSGLHKSRHLHLNSVLPEETTVILIKRWWLQNLGKDCQQVNKLHRNLVRRDSILRK